MKTYIVNSLKEAVRVGKRLDSVSQLQNKEWTVFTDEGGVKETYLFLKKGRLINTINGVSSYFTWEDKQFLFVLTAFGPQFDAVGDFGRGRTKKIITENANLN